MDQYRKTVLTFVALVLVILGFYFFSDWFSKTTGYVLGEDEKINLAICLNDKEAIFYISNTCPDCEKQLELFGNEASKKINIITCQNALECPEGGVPAWKIDNKIYYGVKQLDELMRLSNCEIKK